MDELFQAGGQIHIDASNIPKEIIAAAKDAQKIANNNPITVSVNLTGLSENDIKQRIKNIKKQTEEIARITSSYDNYSKRNKGYSYALTQTEFLIEELDKIFDKYDTSDKGIDAARDFIAGFQATISSGLKLKDIDEEIKSVYQSLSNIDGFLDPKKISPFSEQLLQNNETIRIMEDTLKEMEKVSAQTLKESADTFSNSEKQKRSEVEKTTKVIKQEILKRKSLGQVVSNMSEHGRANEGSGELLAYSSSTTGYASDISISKSATGVAKEFREEVYKRVKEEAEEIDTQIHSHPDNEIAAASFDDIAVMIRQLEDGITKQAVTSLSQVMTFDFNDTIFSKDDLKSKLLNVFEEYKKWVLKYFSLTDEYGNFHELAPFSDEMNKKINEYEKELLKIFQYTDEDILDSDVAQRLFQDKIKELFSKHGIGDVVKLSNLVDIESSFSFSDIRKVADPAFQALTSQTQKAIEEGYAKAQDSHSPSKESEKLNDDFVAGIEESANKNEGKLKNAGKQMSDNIKDGFKEGMSETESTALSLGDQTPLSFFENESGQFTMFDGIEEQQQKVEESVKETNQAIEGQIDLFQHLNSLENNVETNVDNISDMNHIITSAEEAAQAKKDFADANEAVQDSVDDSKSKLELETELMERLASAARMAADAKKEFVDANKIVEESTKKSSDVMQEDKKDDEDESKGSRKNNSYDKYKNIFDQLKSQSGSKIQEFSRQLDIIWPKLERLKQLESIDVDIITDEERRELSELTLEVDKLLSSLDSKENKRKYNIAEQSVVNNLSGQISDFLNKNTAASKEMQSRLEALRIELKQLGLSEADVDRIRTAFTQLKAEMKETGQTGAAFGDKIRKKFQDVAAYFATYVSIYDFINAIKQGYQYVLEIDKQMIELEKVSNSTGQRLEESFEHAKFAAKDLGSTISDVISATADWARMGYNADAAEQLAEVAIIYKNVGDGIDIDTANESLISTLQGFQLEADEAMRIVDVYNEVANTQAISSAGLGEALKRSAASFNAANTSLEKSVALVTATNEVIQNPESVGTLWKTMSARIRGASTELAELSEETDEYTKSSSKLRDLVKGLTGFDIMLDENTFKDIYDIILGIGKEWDKLTDVEQASLGEALAGKRNANALYAVLGNLETLEEAYKSAEGAAGSALKEQEKWEQGLEARTNKLKASLEELSTVFLESDFLGGLIDLGTRAIEVFSKLIDTLGVIPTLLTATGGIGAFKLFKNDGKPNCWFQEYAVNNKCLTGIPVFSYYRL